MQMVHDGCTYDNASLFMQASAFVTAMAEARNSDCMCDLSVNISAMEVQTIIAEASASAMASVCVGALSTCSFGLPMLVECPLRVGN